MNVILVRGVARKFHRGRGWAVPGYQFRKTHERAVAAIVVFRETLPKETYRADQTRVQANSIVSLPLV